MYEYHIYSYMCSWEYPYAFLAGAFQIPIPPPYITRSLLKKSPIFDTASFAKEPTPFGGRAY